MRSLQWCAWGRTIWAGKSLFTRTVLGQLVPALGAKNMEQMHAQLQLLLVHRAAARRAEGRRNFHLRQKEGFRDTIADFRTPGGLEGVGRQHHSES